MSVTKYIKYESVYGKCGVFRVKSRLYVCKASAELHV